jgi:nucleotide-binding universal stress UspA family protein
MFRRILVGYDGSNASRRALSAALDLATCDSGEVLACAVVRPPAFAELKGELEAAIADAKGPLVDAFRRAREQARKIGVPLTLRTRVGHPAETLVRMAEQERCDVIVVGRRDRTQVSRWMLGSVSEPVLRYAYCSVLVVH